MQLIQRISSRDHAAVQSTSQWSGCIPIAIDMAEMKITDECVGPINIVKDVMESESGFSDTNKKYWGDTHSFLRKIAQHNPSYRFYIGTWAASIRQSISKLSEEVSLEDKNDLLHRVPINIPFFIGSPPYPNTFGAVQILSDGFRVYSPHIANRRYSGGQDYFHKASKYVGKALKTVQKFIRAPYPEEWHLLEVRDVAVQRSRGLYAREARVRELTYQFREENENALRELVALRQHTLSQLTVPYMFQNEELLSTVDKFIKAEKELGDAIDPSLENPKCLQRVHIIKDDKGRTYFTRTGIYMNSDYATVYTVYADTPDAEYRPIGEMPESIATKIATLNFLNKGPDEDSPNNVVGEWALNTGLIVRKGELYYLPITKEELEED